MQTTYKVNQVTLLEEKSENTLKVLKQDGRNTSF